MFVEESGVEREMRFTAEVESSRSKLGERILQGSNDGEFGGGSVSA